MNRSAKIYIAGHNGLVGSALTRHLESLGYTHLISRSHAELDLCNQENVIKFFEQERPDYVFMAAAKVGGIHANNTYPAEFIYDNLMVQSNVIDCCWRYNVNRLLFLGSSCIYPKMAPQPIREDYLLTGPLEPTNEPYAIAKIAGIKTCESYNRQYGTRYLSVMPTNLYGPGDNFDLENAHVLPALMRRFHQAKLSGDKYVSVWGTGKPRREFLHVDDMAKACVDIMNLSDGIVDKELLTYPSPCFLNIGTGTDVSIAELCEIIKTVTGYQGEIHYDTTKPDGTMRKLLDVSRINNLGWEAQIELHEGIQKTYDWFLQTIDTIRK